MESTLRVSNLSLIGCATENSSKEYSARAIMIALIRVAGKLRLKMIKWTAKASSSNPYTAGKLCNKMDRFDSEVVFSPNRLLKPLKRSNPGHAEFKKVTWEEAIRDVAQRIKSIVSEKGGEAILPFSYGGNEGIVQNNAGFNFFKHIGASNLGRTICGSHCGCRNWGL